MILNLYAQVPDLSLVAWQGINPLQAQPQMPRLTSGKLHAAQIQARSLSFASTNLFIFVGLRWERRLLQCVQGQGQGRFAVVLL